MSATEAVQQELASAEQELLSQPEQLQSPQHYQENQCHICMGSMKDATAVKGCRHKFCHSCIQQWVSSRQQPCCPVCRADVEFLILADGSEQKVEPAAAPPSEAEPDLSCLDHDYFLAEVSRLLSRAQSVHNRVFKEAYGCGRKGAGRQTGLQLEGVQDVVDTLSGYRSTLQGEMRFDPHVLLQELYRLDRQLTSLQAGDSNSVDEEDQDSTAAAAAAADPWRQHPADNFGRLHLHDEDHYDDHDHGDYDYDSVDDEDCWHQGLSRTPGRRPTQRHVVSHARSNSGSGSQQHTQQQGQQQSRRGR